ncbi:CDP-glycerol glycerophosphotransferase family protein [Actinomadura sp. 9N407]|uniref:CDP-glycerol glycerophosphotransferase family protein n=1 Tax=Actinomadura sp. 9N407 TaxID=3375154 RepID=UPI0037A70599
MRRSFPGYPTLLENSPALFLPVTLGLLLAAALAGGPGWFLGAAILCHLVELAVEQRMPDAGKALRRGQMGPGMRVLTRQAAFVVLLVQAGDVADWTVAAAATGFFLLDWFRTLVLASGAGLRNTNRLPFATRDLGPSEWATPSAESAWQAWLFRMVEGHADAAPLLLGAAGVIVGVPALVPGGLLITAVGTSIIFAGQAGRLRRMRPLLDSARVARDVQRRVTAYKPEVLLYFTGTAVNAYQANMWLNTMERLERKAMVLVRAPEVVGALAPTSLPVVCVTSGEDIMNFDWSTVRVALYTGNTGKNLHLLREPDIKHVFIGHGDSDKDSSSNPVSKVFDEVWVAGPAGRDRYLNSDAGVRDEAIVEVGRPQLSGITAEPSGNPVPTVLYAPTWEGWDSDHSYSSLLPMGEKIIRTLLEQGDRFRVIYRPHPYTGTRTAAALAAHHRVIKLIEQANRSGGVDHRVVTGAEASLHDCFNQSDMLITDISSVISDYMPSLKPYVVANPGGSDESAFKAEFPSASAAYLLGPDCAELAGIIPVAEARGSDPLAEERRKLRDYLLGPEHPDAMTRFATAVDALAAAGPRSTMHAAVLSPAAPLQELL